jgi:hypothetical protein
MLAHWHCAGACNVGRAARLGAVGRPALFPWRAAGGGIYQPRRAD